MARQIRQAVTHGGLPEFKLESQQTRLLINFLQSRKLPVSRWEEVVAPHAHHYFPKSGYVGVQYPPGTGLALAVFPQGEAVYRLNRNVVFVFALVGIGALLLALWRQSWASIGLVVLALAVGLMVLARVGALSFSINAMLVPILMTCLLTVFALRLKTGDLPLLALLCAFIGGLSLGFSILVRLPNLFLMPGFLCLLWPDFSQFRIKSLPIAFGAGVVLTGILPVLINQQEIAGAWYLSTYASVDAAVPTMSRLKFNLSYYFGGGPAAVDNWSLLYAVVGFVGFLVFIFLTRDSGPSNRLGLSWKRLALAVALLWVIPICFFLTHGVTGAHYMIPSVFAAIAVAGFGALGIEATSKAIKPFNPRSVLCWVALVLIVWPSTATLNRVWSTRSLTPAPARASTHPPILLPSELVDDKAWIWADLLTGSLWYYATKPAFKIQFTDADTRAQIFKFVFERGERQYLIQDSERMQEYMREIESLGGKLELKGKIEGQPYFLVVWPSEGPR
jgi:hypothetical protein